jgi:hypothetical protein
MCACFGVSILIFTDAVGFFHVWHEQRVGGAGVETLIGLLIIIVDVLKRLRGAARALPCGGGGGGYGKAAANNC